MVFYFLLYVILYFPSQLTYIVFIMGDRVCIKVMVVMVDNHFIFYFLRKKNSEHPNLKGAEG